MYTQSGVVSCTLSDHSLVYAARKSVKVKSKITFIEARSYRKFDQTMFTSDLTKEDWSPVLESTDVEVAWDSFIQIFVPICDIHAPIKKTRVTDRQPTWINEDYLKLRRDCQRSRSKAEKSARPEDWAEAKRLRNKLNYLADKLKAQDMNSRISNSKSDPRGLWKNLKTLLPGKKQSTISSLETESGTVTDGTDIANTINNFFATVGQKLASKFEGIDDTIVNTSGSNCNSGFHFCHITTCLVLKQLKKLNPHKATGLDNISARLLKAGAEPLSAPLTHIFNLSVTTGTVPSKWKISRVTPLFNVLLLETTDPSPSFLW
ncbi:uncharacterized protein [Amphiura filiformis]|uniref:uncharacterized protein n=1 Tax=Amphiura filiformis TaxID=82378 RepID=UPI003B21BD46